MLKEAFLSENKENFKRPFYFLRSRLFFLPRRRYTTRRAKKPTEK
jgi:hypothetical protein